MFYIIKDTIWAVRRMYGRERPPVSTNLLTPDSYHTFTASPSTEMVEGMWLGVTVASQRGQAAGRVLVRLQFTPLNHAVQGTQNISY